MYHRFTVYLQYVCGVADASNKRQGAVLGSLLVKLRLGEVKSPILHIAMGSLPADECHLGLGRLISSNLKKGIPQHIAKRREETGSSDLQNSR